MASAAGQRPVAPEASVTIDGSVRVHVNEAHTEPKILRGVEALYRRLIASTSYR